MEPYSHGKPSHPIFLHWVEVVASVIGKFKSTRGLKKLISGEISVMLKHWLGFKATVGSWGMEEAQSLSIRTEHLSRQAKLCLGKELTPKCIWQL